MFLAIPAMADTPENSRPKFDPERFEASLEQFITTKAGLTPQEAERFFPVYREMQSKIRAYFNEMRRLRHTDINDNVMSEKAIRRIDSIDIEIKKIQQKYHNSFFKILPAGKVLEILKAEDKFHRQAFKEAFAPKN
ncbi:hypothetical protein prwr041_00890 [Prevotella herbatica]|uniref:Periplasmic heavy metal sensor n=2 Tax=Prevotella herbatica TaxID=2801997 RepID=A0ABM7NUP0_9BACT|nr:hypothetical protein prwr041_00890 [Prevotella herbatica]